MSVAALAVAVTLDLLFADPPNALHPVAWMGRGVAVGRRVLAQGSAGRLVIAGGLLIVALVAIVATAGAVVHRLAEAAGGAAFVVEGLALWTLLSVRGLARAAALVADALDCGDLVAARAALGEHLVSRDVSALDAGHVASGAVESVAENLTDALVAPACFYLAFGLPGAAAYRVINTADAMIGYREGVLEHFGKVAARVDDAANWLPARIAALALVAAASLRGASGGAALRGMRRDARWTASPNAGWTMAAMAGALGVTLDKPGAYRLGDGPLPGVADVRRAIQLLYTGAAVALTFCAFARVAAAIE